MAGAVGCMVVGCCTRNSQVEVGAAPSPGKGRDPRTQAVRAQGTEDGLSSHCVALHCPGTEKACVSKHTQPQDRQCGSNRYKLSD